MLTLNIAPGIRNLEAHEKIARAKINQVFLGLLVISMLSLCGYGVANAILALVKIIRRTHPSSGVNAFFDYPWWSFAHFVPGIIFLTLGPLQFWAGFRNRYRRLHRWSGRCVIAAGLVLAVSGISFPFTMPERPMSEQVFFVTVFIVFLFFLLKAYSLARRRQFALHRVWMIRMFGSGIAAITQRAIFPIFAVAVGIHSMNQFWELFVTAAWLSWAVNLAVIESWISYTQSRTKT